LRRLLIDIRSRRSAKDSEVPEQSPQKNENQYGAEAAAAELPGAVTGGETAKDPAHDALLSVRTDMPDPGLPRRDAIKPYAHCLPHAALATRGSSHPAAADAHRTPNVRLRIAHRIRALQYFSRDVTWCRQTLRHLVHLRAQLTVDLRILDIPVPCTCGSTANDRGDFGV
jgi:hypothetical protein